MVKNRVKNNGELSALIQRQGRSRTDMDCHGCTEAGISPNVFTVEIDYDINGNHAIHCPRCGHVHYRVIDGGLVTGERFDSGYPTITVSRGLIWKSKTAPILSSVRSAFLRDRWLQSGSD